MTAHGHMEPGIWTPNARELTDETSLGFACVRFIREFLHENPYPWQEWLIQHALELNPDGSLRFPEVLVGMGRQNGKTKVVEWLTQYWLYVDSLAHPDKVRPEDFTVLGVAQVLDVAKKPYSRVAAKCDPKPPTPALAKRADPRLQALTDKVSRVNGDEGIYTINGACYMPRAAVNVRGLTAARVIFDELREQKTEDGWAAVEPVGENVWSSQLWAITSAGDYRSVTLRNLYEDGKRQAQTEDHPSIAIYWWGVEDNKCPLDDDEAILAANPTIGYGSKTLAKVKGKIGGMSEAKYRAEYLNQWVTADVTSYISPTEWKSGEDPHSRIADDSRIVLSVYVTSDGSTSWIAAAGRRDDGRPHVEVIARRDGMRWVPNIMRAIKQTTGAHEVAVRTRGERVVDLIDDMQAEGYQIDAIEGPKFGAAVGQFKSRVRERRLMHLPQPAVDEAIGAAVSRKLGDLDVWDPKNSALDIGGLIAESYALYGLEQFEEQQPETRASAYVDHPLMII